MANRTTWTTKKRERFLKSLSEGASVTRAAVAVAVSRQSCYDLRERDTAFAEQWDAAVEAGTDVLEDEALRRAKDGTNEPVFYQGVRCGLVRKYSDTLLIFLLKARRPAKFSDRQSVALSGPNGEPLAAPALTVKFVNAADPAK